MIQSSWLDTENTCLIMMKSRSDKFQLSKIHQFSLQVEKKHQPHHLQGSGTVWGREQDGFFQRPDASDKEEGQLAVSEMATDKQSLVLMQEVGLPAEWNVGQTGHTAGKNEMVETAGPEGWQQDMVQLEAIDQ